MTRNLIYFIYWQPSSEMLQFNLKLMDRYIHLFDGQRIIKVAGISELHPVVLKAYPWLREAKFVKNDPEFGEAKHFLESLKELKPEGITFYAHAKGVTREVNKPLKWWVELLYKGNLETLPNLDGKLFSGCFGKLRQGSKNVPVPWHYSGSFYWFDTVRVINRLAFLGYEILPSEIKNRWFTESFPGWIAKESEAEFRLHASAEPRYNLYRQEFWDRNKHLLKLL